MKNAKWIVISLIVVFVAAVVGYIFWPLPKTPPKRTKHVKPNPTPLQTIATNTTNLQNAPPAPLSKNTSNLSTLATSSIGISIKDESPYEFHQYTTDSGGVPFVKDTGYRGIGERDLFCLLIPPPPPPPPHQRSLLEITRNWILWEIVDENECVIADARPLNHNLHIGEQLEGVVINKILPSEDKVQLALVANKNDTRWLQLQAITVITNGWKLKGTVPSLKIAFIVTGDNKSNKVKVGDVLQHCLIKKVSQGKVVLTYGTMSKELSQ